MNNIENTIQETKDTFADYFNMIGSKNFKQFYYDWHVDNMLAPFAGMVYYFNVNFGDKAKDKFHEFVEDVTLCVSRFDADKPQLSPLTTKKHSNTTDGKLTNLLNGMRTFGFEFRQFVYSFASKKDHMEEFGYWPIKTNMPYSSKHGLMVAKDILKYLDVNFDKICDGQDIYHRALYAADTYLRKNIVKDYQYTHNYTFADRKEYMRKLHHLRNQLSYEFNTMEHDNPKLNDMFQIENNNVSAPSTKTYWPSGFELEFYVPEEYGNYETLISYLKEKNGWEKLYSSNSDSSVYHDPKSAGVIMRDESLAPYNGLAPVEFASRIMRSKEDEAYCLKILDSFDYGHVNKHCSLHQHLSTKDFTMDTYKRLVKRMMQHEDEIVSAFAAPERGNNNLLYATYIGRNLSENNKRDYPFLAIMVDLCETKQELEEMSAFGNKYKTLNVLPSHTIEMRAMNANFNKRFVEAYLQFNREFVAAAVENNPHHVNRFLLNKYTWHNNQSTDTKTVMHDLSYGYDFVPHDSYRPMKKPITSQIVQDEQEYARMVMQALTTTGKLGYVNPSHQKRVKEVKSNAR